jgi:hypothetical protein
MSYRNDLDALSARHASLDAELAAKTKELGDATRMLDEARARARLPVLDNIRIASPCRADWNDMVGDERTRACGKCEKQVFNISNLTRAEAEALIAEKHGKLCARYYQRRDGTIILADCTIGAVAARNRKLVAAGAAALLVTGVGYKLTHRTHDLDMDAIDITASADSTDGHVAGVVEREAPPPTPIERLQLVMPESVVESHPLMGDISFEPSEVYK